jgi:type I restriction enzyme, S subunit
MSLHPTVPLAEAAEIAAGITLGRKAKEKELIEVPYLRVANVQDGHLLLDELKTIAATRSEIRKWALLDGDLLLTEGGDLDKLGRGACWRNQVPLCIHQNHIFRVRLPKDRYDPDYVSFQIGAPYGKAYFLAHAKKTTGIASINQRVLGAFPLFSPPIAEQRCIAARLKAQLGEIDTARQAAQAQANDIALLRRRVLAEVFTAVEDAPRKRIGDHATTTSGSTPSRGNKAYWTPAEVPWVKTAEIDFASITHVQERISLVALAECSLAVLPAKTVLVAITGEGKTRGRSAVLEIPATNNQHSVAILPNEIWDPYFMQLWLQTSYHDLRELSEGRGGSRSALSGVQIKALEVPAPSREVQTVIACRAQNALRELQALSAANQAQRTELERLPQRLLALAFGEA